MRFFVTHLACQLGFLSFLLIALLSACVTMQPAVDKIGPISKIFYTNYQKVWQAVMLVLEDYPIEVENNEKGYIKTELIEENTLWKPPFLVKKTEGKYRLIIKIKKGKSNEDPVVQVSIWKKITFQKGFISEPEIAPSSGLEEKALLYRIFREITIGEGIANYYQKKSRKQN